MQIYICVYVCSARTDTNMVSEVSIIYKLSWKRVTLLWLWIKIWFVKPSHLWSFRAVIKTVIWIVRKSPGFRHKCITYSTIEVSYFCTFSISFSKIYLHVCRFAFRFMVIFAQLRGHTATWIYVYKCTCWPKMKQ